LTSTKYSQTTVQDPRKTINNPNQTAKNWDVILPSNNFLNKLAASDIIDPNSDLSDFIICLSYGGNHHTNFFGNLESIAPSRAAFFKTTETDGIDWVLYQRINGRLYKIKTVLRCKPNQNAIFTGSIFDHEEDVFALVTVAFSKKKLMRIDGDTIPVQKQFLYKLNEKGDFVACKNKSGKKIESKPYCKNPFDWRDPNPVLNLMKVNTGNKVSFVGCGSDEFNRPCISNGTITFVTGKNPVIRKLKPTNNLPQLIFQNQPVITKYLECPQKIILPDCEVLFCSVGVDFNGNSKHFLAGYIKNNKEKIWSLVNGTGVVSTNYTDGFQLYAPKFKMINNSIKAVGWNAGPSGLPHSQSPYLDVIINGALKTVVLV
jgi:hypothetical protein